MFGDMKHETKVQSWEEIVQAMRDNMDKDLDDYTDKHLIQAKVRFQDKLVTLEKLMQHYRKVKSSLENQQDQRRDPPPILSADWREQPEEIKNHLKEKLQLIQSKLKPCLLSLAIFPENSIIKKRSLIYWWIGQRLVSQSGNKTAEQVGEEVYNEFLQQGVFEPDDTDPSPLMKRCKMQPLIGYMLLSEAEKEGLFYFESKDKTSHEDLKNLSSSCLRLIVGGEDGQLYRDLAKDEHVHTVFNVNQQYLSLKPHSLLNMKQLAVLQLGRWQHSPNYHIEVHDQKFLDDLGVHHKHLKFLSLRGISGIIALPDSIVKLVNLEILDLRACYNLEKLPEDIASLKKLTHLDVSQCYLIECMPKGIEKLSSLQVLKGFVIRIVRNNPCKISEFPKLTKLTRLSIYIGYRAVIKDEEFASLKNVASLRSLTICWERSSLAFQFSLPISQFLPKQLEKLELIGMPEASIPKWLNPQELENLKKLYITGGELASWDSQEQNEQWSVEILRLKHLRKLRIGNMENVLKKFPRLRHFQKINCDDNDVLW